MNKRILLLTFFYPPDLSAGSFRAHALVNALCEEAGNDVYVDVITTQPNRYHAQARASHSLEQEGNVRIRRISIPPQEGGLPAQAKNFISFALGAVRLARQDQYDVVIATSSRLMTALLGLYVATRKRIRLYLDIRDIFVENLKELFPSMLAAPLRALFSVGERAAIKHADGVNLVSAGFLGYFRPKYPGRQFSTFSNGVDLDFANFPAGTPRSAEPHTPLQILYAGNIGDGQGLHLIIPQLAQQLEGRVHFRIIGGGGRLEELRKQLKIEGVDNVELVAPIARKQLLEMYQQADVLFLHLNSFDAFLRVIPSKVFEYAATGKPVWAGVGGYAADFINENIANAAVFQPCDVAGAQIALGKLELIHTPRPEFVQRYGRERIMRCMAKDILSLCE